MSVTRGLDIWPRLVGLRFFQPQLQLLGLPRNALALGAEGSRRPVTRFSVIAREKLVLLGYQHGAQHPSSQWGGEALALLREQRASHYGTVKLIWFDGPLSTPLASTLFISYT
jgi:hypothetical protein